MKTISTSLWTAPGIPGISRWNEKKHVWWINRVCSCGRVSKRTHLDTTSRQEWRSPASPLTSGATAGEFLQSSPRQTCWPGTPASKCSQGCVLSSRRLPWIFFCMFFSHYWDCGNTALVDTGKLQTQQLRLFRDVKCVFKVKTDLSLHCQAFISKLSAFLVWDRLQDLRKGASQQPTVVSNQKAFWFLHGTSFKNSTLPPMLPCNTKEEKLGGKRWMSSATPGGNLGHGCLQPDYFTFLFPNTSQGSTYKTLLCLMRLSLPVINTHKTTFTTFIPSAPHPCPGEWLQGSLYEMKINTKQARSPHLF